MKNIFTLGRSTWPTEKMYLGISRDLLILFNWVYVITAPGTTPHFKDLFIGRCWAYQSKKNVGINCDNLWKSFVEGFAFKDPCDATIDYKSFFRMLEKDSNATLNNTMFYSGAKELVDHFTHINDDFVVLEETLTGFLLDNMDWCGSKTSADGMNYTKCPSWGSNCDIRHHFWRIASRVFALRAVGTAHTLLNASRKGGRAYYKNGYFRKYEMPVLSVKHLVVYVATNIINPSAEKCGTDSLLELDADAKKKDIAVTCVDQPALVLRVFCLKYPEAHQCRGITDTDTVLWKTVSIVFIILTATIIVSLALYKGRKYYKVKYDLYLRRISYTSKKSVINLEETQYNNNEEA